MGCFALKGAFTVVESVGRGPGIVPGTRVVSLGALAPRRTRASFLTSPDPALARWSLQTGKEEKSSINWLLLPRTAKTLGGIHEMSEREIKLGSLPQRGKAGVATVQQACSQGVASCLTSNWRPGWEWMQVWVSVQPLP